MVFPVTIPGNLPDDETTLGLRFHYALLPAFMEASEQMYTALMSVPRALRDLVAGLLRGNSSGVMGPVGITQVVVEAVPVWRLADYLGLIAVLSLNLAIFNLLPIPGLDGGRLVFVIAEIIMRGRKLDARKEGYIHLAGFVFLLMLIFVISYFDVTRVLSGKSPFSP